MARVESIKVMLTSQEKRLIKKAAKRKGVSQNEYIREAVRDKLSSKP